MLTIWFMFDNHTFHKVKATDRAGLIAEAAACFAEDGCGGLFVRDASDATMRSLELQGRILNPKDNYKKHRWGVTPEQLEEWADKVFAEQAFQLAMVA